VMPGLTRACIFVLRSINSCAKLFYEADYVQ
jgi:hypothetical protein